jgi:hypothetical protein
MEKKIKVMEALLSCSNGLSKEEILWAESHLPNENGKKCTIGPNSVVRFNHDANTINEAMNISVSNMEDVADLIATSVRDSPKLSIAVEKVIQNAHAVPNFWEMLALKAVKDCHDHFASKMKGLEQLPDHLEQIKKMMEELKKLKGDNPE